MRGRERGGWRRYPTTSLLRERSTSGKWNLKGRRSGHSLFRTRNIWWVRIPIAVPSCFPDSVVPPSVSSPSASLSPQVGDVSGLSGLVVDGPLVPRLGSVPCWSVYSGCFFRGTPSSPLSTATSWHSWKLRQRTLSEVVDRPKVHTFLPLLVTKKLRPTFPKYDSLNRPFDLDFLFSRYSWREVSWMGVKVENK